MVFRTEADFEAAVIQALSQKGWESTVLRYPTEADLLKNWADILFANNRSIDRLNDAPLTDGEMAQILEQIKALRSPVLLNGFINGKSVTIKRDNPADPLHFGKEVSLKIYDRREIAAGQSRYQIAQQPVFHARNPILNDRRGDLMLLINGMPVIHIELKRTGISVTQATNQIEKYAHEGVFSGLFALVQIFVAMEPNETVYFANPGPDGQFNKDFYFHWGDVNNEPINDWKRITSDLLSIPMAHTMIGFYTVADNTDGILKVMRSYQYYAASRIADRVAKIQWDGKDRLGGYIWHTTGSGKTMTSFKSAQLIADDEKADKVIFMVDRIELGTQSLMQYRNFAGAGLTPEQRNKMVQATEDSQVLISKLKSNDPATSLIVTSIQKMAIIASEDNGRNQHDLDLINRKRIVIIVDECHRDTFGDMMHDVKKAFPTAVFFGFSGTPIFEENAKSNSDTSDVFGNELHRYTIADGIRDKNVLGFDPYMVVYGEQELRQAVALDMAKASTVTEAIKDPVKSRVFYEFMDPHKVPMAGFVDRVGIYHKGIEDYVPRSQYQTDQYIDSVIKDIQSHFPILSHGGKFHAIFATSSIPEAIVYYRRMKVLAPELKVAALFDPSIDNSGDEQLKKEDGLIEIITDYNNRYDQHFTLTSAGNMKKDIAARLAHKEPYRAVSKTPEKQIDILIVVDQMLTGYDSKWVNTLYMDKMIQNEAIIQAFSRTNRLFGPEKPFGVIRYYRKPYTMKKRIDSAVALYSGNRPFGLFAHKLYTNLVKLNETYQEIERLFMRAGISDFHTIDGLEPAECARFAKLFRVLNDYLEAAKIQGFDWDKNEYRVINPDIGDKETVVILFDKQKYLTLAQRYKELFSSVAGSSADVPYEIDSHLVEIDTGRIDTDYMNSRFTKYLKALGQPNIDENELQDLLNDLHQSYAGLPREEQKYATLFLHDVQTGSIIVESGKTFRDYITEYMGKAKDDQIHRVSVVFGLDETMLRNMVETRLTEHEINAYGRFDALKATVDKAKARSYLENSTGSTILPFMVMVEVDKLLRGFILKGDFDLPLDGNSNGVDYGNISQQELHVNVAEDGTAVNKNMRSES